MWARAMWLVTSAVFLLAASPGPPTPTAGALKAQAQQVPNKEEVTSTKAREGIEGIRGAKATFIVAADGDVVLDLLWDVEAFPRIFPDIDKMQVLHKADERVDVHFEVDAIVTDATYNLRRRLDRKKGEIRWQEFGEGDVKHIRGAWTVLPTGVPGYCRVIYASYVDLGYFIPSGPVRDVAIRKIDEMAERVNRGEGGRRLDD